MTILISYSVGVYWIWDQSDVAGDLFPVLPEQVTIMVAWISHQKLGNIFFWIFCQNISLIVKPLVLGGGGLTGWYYTGMLKGFSVLFHHFWYIDDWVSVQDPMSPICKIPLPPLEMQHWLHSTQCLVSFIYSVSRLSCSCDIGSLVQVTHLVQILQGVHEWLVPSNINYFGRDS